MNENLNELIQQTPADEAVKFDVSNLELPQEESPQEDASAEDQPITEQQAETAEAPQQELADNQIPITTLGEWYRTFSGSFPNIHQSNLGGISGVDTNEYLMVSIDDPDGVELTPGTRKRSLKLWDDPQIQAVLNIEPSDIQIYKTSFKVIYPIDENTLIKMYAVKNGLIAMFCHPLNDGLLPYAKVVAKKKDDYIEIQTHDIELYRQQLDQPVNMETLHLLYKQSAKADNFTTKAQAINWLLSRQDNITDINHHLQIDEVIMTLLR